MGAALLIPEGVTRLSSPHTVGATIDRLSAAAEGRGMTVFARIDHAAGAAAAGLRMPPSEVLIFGIAIGGTPLMRAAPTIGLDLPLKALAWEDGGGATWLGFNDPAWLARRHGLPSALRASVQDMTDGLAAMAREAVAAAPGTVL